MILYLLLLVLFDCVCFFATTAFAAAPFRTRAQCTGIRHSLADGRAMVHALTKSSKLVRQDIHRYPISKAGKVDLATLMSNGFLTFFYFLIFWLIIAAITRLFAP
jgi:hypothetical protein